MNKTSKQVNTVSHSEAAAILALLGIELEQGESRQVNVTLSLSGVISKGVDTEAAATVKVLSLASVGCLMRHCGATRDTALEKLIAIAAGTLKPTAEDEAFAAEVKSRVALELPPIPVSGRRSGALAVSPHYAATMPELAIPQPAFIPLPVYERGLTLPDGSIT